MKETYFLYFKDRQEPFDILEVKDQNRLMSISNSREIYELNAGVDSSYKFFVEWLNNGKNKGGEAIMVRGQEIFIEKSLLNRGEYYPRIFRPIYNHFPQGIFSNRRRLLGYGELAEVEDILNEDAHNIIRSNLVQLDTLISLLKNIFSSIFPSHMNFQTFGHDIRNLIILCATEAEAQMKGILKSNNYHSTRHFFTTRDYVKLVKPLKLKDYSIRFRYFPDVPPINPFDNWDANDSTNSLEWYANYNSIKHDRENSFHKSTLKTALEAISACIILSISQFGTNSFHEIFGSYFELHTSPTFTYREAYLYPERGELWSAKYAKI